MAYYSKIWWPNGKLNHKEVLEGSKDSHRIIIREAVLQRASNDQKQHLAMAPEAYW